MTGHAGYEVLAVKFGTRRTRRSEVFLNYRLYGEPDDDIDMDYYFWVIRNDRRVVLVDCGFSPDGGARRERTSLAEPVSILAGMGIQPESVDRLIVTHAHYDHIGNLVRFPAADIVVAAAEIAFWTGPYARREQFAHAVDNEDLAALQEAVRKKSATLVDTVAEIEPGIRVMPVGGHTPGQLIVIADTESGQVMLTSDAVHYYEELERDRPFCMLTHLPEMYAAFDLIREFRSEPGAIVVAGHDPAVTERFPRFTGDPTGLTRRVA